MGGISVTGGAGSTSARFDDMHAVAALMTHNATEIEHVIAIARHLAQDEADRVQVGLDLLTRTEVGQALDDVVTATAHGLETASRLRTSADRLVAAVAWYRFTEAGQSSSFLDSVIDLPLATVKSVVTFSTTLDPIKMFNTFVTSDPALASDAGILLMLADAHFGADYPDGHATVTSLPPDGDPAAMAQPRNLGDLLNQLAIRNHGQPGEISVSFTFGAPGHRYVVVNIPGTKSFDPFPTSNVTSLSTDARAIAGLGTAYEQGVLEAMTQAGVQPTDDVMLVGHSEGGMVAVAAARDAIKSKRFNVTHIVTAGSPIALELKSLPSSVQVLALENGSDIVPELDGHTNPATSNITTVTGNVNHNDIVANHLIEDSYEHIAEQADRSGNTSIRAFVTSAKGFLTGCGQDVHRFVIHRRY